MSRLTRFCRAAAAVIYTFTDTQIVPKLVYYYWLQEIAASGAEKEIDLVQGGIDLEGLRKLFMPFAASP